MNTNEAEKLNQENTGYSQKEISDFKIVYTGTGNYSADLLRAYAEAVYKKYSFASCRVHFQIILCQLIHFTIEYLEKSIAKIF